MLKFLLLFRYLNLFSLPEDKKKEVIEKIKITITKAILLFEYKKANKRYWDRSKLYYQVVNKVLPIAEVFYLGFSLLFLFDNTTSYLVYA